MKKLIKNGLVFTDGKLQKTNILIKGEIIERIGRDVNDAPVVIDASGCYVLPGGIDPHTHMELDVGTTVSSDNFYTGQVAAAFGGTTTHLDYPTPRKGESLKESFNKWLDKAKNKAVIDFGFHLTVVEVNNKILKELEEIIDWGVQSIKVYMAYKNILQLSDEEIFRVMKKAARKKILVEVHAENGDVIDFNIKSLIKAGKTSPKYHAQSRPPLLEAEAVNRAIYLANAANANVYIVHLTAEASLNQIIQARKAGLKVFAETCPQYLFLTEDLLNLPNFEGAKFVCSPPLRKHSDIKALWDGLAANQINTIATDHCPFNFKGQKELGKKSFNEIPNGLPGVENRITLLFSEGVKKEKLSLKQFVALTSTNAAKLFGFYPRKGTISEGSDADFYLLNPNKESVISAKTHHMNVDYNPYEGYKLSCKIEKVFSRGELIVDGNRLLAERGRGIYLNRTPFEQ